VPKNHQFLRLHDLSANLTANIFGTKHDIDNREVHWKLQGIPAPFQYSVKFGLQTA